MSFYSSNFLSKLLLLALFSNVALAAIQLFGYDNSSKVNCVALQADAITGSIQYFNINQNGTVKYDFEVDPTTVVPTGSCARRVGFFFLDTIVLKFSPKKSQANDWEIRLRFSQDPNTVPKTFAVSDYSLKALFSASFNSSVFSHVYQSDVMPYDLQATTPGNGFSCSSATLKIGANSWLKFSKLSVLANFQNTTQPVFDNFAYDKCAADAIPDAVSGVSGWLIFGIIVLVLIALGAIGGGVYYYKRVHASH